jgi:hypothetical protein
LLGAVADGVGVFGLVRSCWGLLGVVAVWLGVVDFVDSGDGIDCSVVAELWVVEKSGGRNERYGEVLARL